MDTTTAPEKPQVVGKVVLLKEISWEGLSPREVGTGLPSPRVAAPWSSKPWMSGFLLGPLSRDDKPEVLSCLMGLTLSVLTNRPIFTRGNQVKIQFWRFTS